MCVLHSVFTIDGFHVAYPPKMGGDDVGTPFAECFKRRHSYHENIIRREGLLCWDDRRPNSIVPEVY